MNHEDDLNPSTRCLSFGPSGLAAQQARNTERAAQNQAELAEQAEKKQARQARQAEWDHAKQVRAMAREPYEDMTKAELSDELTKRGLPKAGKVSDLIDRLAEADSSS